MATTLTLKKATPYSLVYEMAGDGAKGTYAGATLVSACVAGPLRTLLSKLTTASKLDTLDLDAARSKYVRIRHVEGITATQVSPATRIIHWITTGLEVTATAASVCEIEIRFAHSNER